MTYCTCPHCHYTYCPAVGPHRYLCPECRRVYTMFPSSFESRVRATGAAFKMQMARILKTRP